MDPKVEVWTAEPKVGLYAVKFAKSVYACRPCKSPVVITAITENGKPVYFCPKCKKKRNRQHIVWLEYQTQCEFRKVGL